MRVFIRDSLINTRICAMIRTCLFGRCQWRGGGVCAACEIFVEHIHAILIALDCTECLYHGACGILFLNLLVNEPDEAVG